MQLFLIQILKLYCQIRDPEVEYGQIRYLDKVLELREIQDRVNLVLL